MVHAKTLLGRINFASDLVNEQLYPSPLRDEATHLTAELLLGRGSLTKRFVRWGGKFAKYGSIRPPKREVTGSMAGLLPIITAETLGLASAEGQKKVRRKRGRKVKQSRKGNPS